MLYAFGDINGLCGSADWGFKLHKTPTPFSLIRQTTGWATNSFLQIFWQPSLAVAVTHMYDTSQESRMHSMCKLHMVQSLRDCERYGPAQDSITELNLGWWDSESLPNVGRQAARQWLQVPDQSL